jgi:hypothetical protein
VRQPVATRAANSSYSSSKCIRHSAILAVGAACVTGEQDPPRHAFCNAAFQSRGCAKVISSRRMVSSGMLRRVALVRTDVSEELSARLLHQGDKNR